MPAEAWNGEYLPQGYGAFYTRVRLQSFKKNSIGTGITGNVFFHLHEEKQNRRFIVSQSIQDSETGVQVWKLPVGNYLLYKVSLNDNLGKVRSWQVSMRAKDKPIINIRHLFLSNLGFIFLNPVGNQSLLLRLVPSPNVFKNTYGHETFVGIIDASTMKVQEKMGGKNLYKDAAEEFSSPDEARAAFSFQRQIAMVYKLDIGKQRGVTLKLINTLASQDLDLRRCYSDELEKTENLKGNVRFSFTINRDSGQMQKIQFRGGNINNQRVKTCLFYTLGKMQFPVTSNVPGNISFYFSYSDEPGRKSP